MCYVAAHTSIYTLSLHDALPICHLALLHRFEQGGLRPGRGSIDLVDQDDVGEDGAGDEAERTGDLVEHADTREVGGEEVGGRLDPGERPTDRCGEGAREGGLPHARNPLQQQVAIREHADRSRPDGVVVAGDDRGDVLREPLEGRRGLAEGVVRLDHRSGFDARGETLERGAGGARFVASAVIASITTRCARIAVISAVSYGGDTSTTSIPASSTAPTIWRTARSSSRARSPPASGVPVPGAIPGSTTSMSTER